MALSPEAAAIVAQLELKPHPEGGHYRETFRDLSVDADGRSRSTAIYFLLARGERSHWHRIDAVETWHYYAGAALTLQIADNDGQRGIRLGPRGPRGRLARRGGELPVGFSPRLGLAGRAVLRFWVPGCPGRKPVSRAVRHEAFVE